MGYNIFLDDERYPHKVTWVDLPLVEWVIIRNYNDFVKIITDRGAPTHVSYDHDLAGEHYPQGVGIYVGDPRIKDIKLPYDEYKEKTGFHAAKWLCEYCLDKNIPHPSYTIHTMNPVGLLNIQSIIDSYYKSLGKEPIPATSPNLIGIPSTNGGIFVP
jgi:hypothetical protein